jgi:hypothetical protein
VKTLRARFSSLLYPTTGRLVSTPLTIKKGIRQTRYDTKKRFSQLLWDFRKNCKMMIREAVIKLTSV